ncbi:MAG: hypothetical protein HZB19_02695 [Chloroflexi bacterium]|nr:hypothetical protein [Chloroflexota bacterium]
MANRTQKVALEKIAAEKLSRQVIKDIDAIEVEVWEKVEPGLSLKIGKKVIELRLNYRTSTRKFIAWLSGIVTTTGSIIAVLKWLAPILVGYFAKPPP